MSKKTEGKKAEKKVVTDKTKINSENKYPARKKKKDTEGPDTFTSTMSL